MPVTANAAPAATTAAPSAATATSSPGPLKVSIQEILHPKFKPTLPVAQPAASPAAAAAPAAGASTVGGAGEASAPVSTEQAAAELDRKTTDPVADALASLTKQDREVKRERDKIKADRAGLEEKAKHGETVTKARELFKAGDYAGALSLIDPEMNLDAVSLALLEQLSSRDAKPLSQADVEAIAKKKVDDDAAEKQKKVEEESKKRLEKANASYLDACVEIYKTNATKFPLVTAIELQREDFDARIIRYATGQHREGNGVPAPDQVLEYFEKKLEAELKAAGYSRAEIREIKQATAAQGASAAPIVAGPAAKNTGGAEGAPAKRPTLAEKREKVRASLRAADAARKAG